MEPTPNHVQLNKDDFKDAIKLTPTFIKIGNTEFQKLYFKQKTFEDFYENYRQAVRYSIDYLKQKPQLQSRDVKIIEEILNK